MRNALLLLLILTAGCLPVATVPEPRTAAPNNCTADATIHGAGVIGAAAGSLTSLGFAWASLEVSPTGNTPQTLADVGLVAGAVGLASVGLIALGALDYAADKCAGPLPPLAR